MPPCCLGADILRGIFLSYRLIKLTQTDDWRSYHDIRRIVLFEGRGRFGIYNENQPDEYVPTNYPLLLKFNGQSIGTTRVDNFEDGTGAVRLVAIVKSEQGKGHGRILSGLVDDFARSLGIDTLYVNVAPEAVGYYNRTGWMPFIWSQEELSGISEGCVQMKKSLALVPKL